MTPEVATRKGLEPTAEHAAMPGQSGRNIRTSIVDRLSERGESLSGTASLRGLMGRSGEEAVQHRGQRPGFASMPHRCRFRLDDALVSWVSRTARGIHRAITSGLATSTDR